MKLLLKERLVFFFAFFLLSNTYTICQINNVNTFTFLNQCKYLGNIPKINDKSIVVLDFWSTWCAPCITSFPHTFELSKKYENNNFVFIAITPESERIVNLFLKRQKIPFVIALDTLKELHKKYKVDYIPRCIIVDSKDNILWEGHPMRLNYHILDSISISYNSPNLQKSVPKVLEDTISSNKTNLFSSDIFALSMTLKPSQSKASISISSIDVLDSGTVFKYTNKTVCNILKDFIGLQTTRFECGVLDAKKWDLQATLYNIFDVQKGQKILKDILMNYLNLRIDTIQKRIEVVHIYCVDTILLNTYMVNPNEYEGLHHASINDSLFSSANLTLDDLAYNLEDIFSLPVVNSCKNNSHYNFSFNINSFDDVEKSLAEVYGIRLEKIQEYIKVFRIIQL